MLASWVCVSICFGMIKNVLLIAMGAFMVSACSVFGASGVEEAPYKVLRIDGVIEVRHYDSMILAVTPMSDGSEERRAPFYRLFKYITGENVASKEILMTAPVFMAENEGDAGIEIPMTAPVFMGGEETMMSFVLPDEYTMETAPKPTDPQGRLQEVKDYMVAAIRFSGLLSKANTDKYEVKLRSWIEGQPYSVNGDAVTAGYNAPFTIPALRRNEVFIPVKVSE